MRQNTFRLVLGAVAILASLTAGQAAQKTVTTKDAPGTGTLSFCAFDAGSFGLSPCNVPVNSSGVELFTPGNPGSVGLAFGGSSYTLGQKASAAGIGVTLSTEQEAILTAVRTALGACTEAAYTGTGTATLCSVMKGLFGQAAPTSNPGSSIGGATPVPGFQGVLGGIAMDTVVKGAASDVGGTITAGGTAQQFMAANANRRGWHLENQSSSPLYVRAVPVQVGS